MAQQRAQAHGAEYEEDYEEDEVEEEGRDAGFMGDSDGEEAAEIELDEVEERNDGVSLRGD